MNELLTALYNRLTTQLSVAVYDHVPQDTESYPYVVMRLERTDNQDTDTQTAFSAIIRVTAYSRYRGFSELATLSDEIHSALNNWYMADTATHTIGTIKEKFRQYVNSPDNLTRYSVSEYIFYYEPI
jgi:hypothetical protein